jgi:hypothetical protein
MLRDSFLGIPFDKFFSICGNYDSVIYGRALSSVEYGQGVAAQHTFVRDQAGGWLSFGTISTVGLQPSYEGTHDCPNNLILDIE